MIPYGHQDISEEDINAVVEVLKSDWLTQGPLVPKFEKTVSDYCRVRHAISFNSATSALHAACLALEVGPGDWVWTSPITFVASANCALYCGANIDFIDIDPVNFNISVERLAEKLAIAEISGTLPKVVIPVHFCGQSCDMRRIGELAKRYGFKIIEDASHAIGAAHECLMIERSDSSQTLEQMKDIIQFTSSSDNPTGGASLTVRDVFNPVGSCIYSDITIFSFHPVKIITTGEGGMATTNSDKLRERLCRLRSHGITTNSSEMFARCTQEIWNYQQIELGFNYRMTDIQAALGISQMKRLNEFVSRRNFLAKRYKLAFDALPVSYQLDNPLALSSYHLFPVRICRKKSRIPQREVYKLLHDADIAANLHYIPVYLQPYYERLGFKAGYCQEAENYFKEAISLPMFSSLREEDQDFVIEKLAQILAQ